VTDKVALHGADDTFKLAKPGGHVFGVDAYINPPDPNHLHYYIWRWYAGIAGGRDEVVRHALAGEIGNDVIVMGPGFTGVERYRISSWNRTRKQFTVLIYSGAANGKAWAKVRLPATVRSGQHFLGEGFADGETYRVRIETKNMDPETGEDAEKKVSESEVLTVEGGALSITVPQMKRFTRLDFFLENSNGK